MISWNCQGLGSSLTIQTLKELIREHKPTIIFLMETKNSKNKLETLRTRIGMDNCEYVDPIGHSSGLMTSVYYLLQRA